ncbi:MAG: transporter substrate-binding domain-containing protein [Actinomycetota bacterium]
MDLPKPSPEAVAALAPTGTLRAAINLSNFLLVTGEADDGNPRGVSPGMAAALAEHLGVGLELLRYESPGAVADDGDADAWDIGNIGAEPQRARFINFTAAYAEIEATYLVRADADISSIDQVDKPGRTIIAPDRAAYALWLERNIQHAELTLLQDRSGTYDAWVERRIDALAGLRPGLIGDHERTPGSQLLDGCFMTVQQAMGTPNDRDVAGFDYLRRFVEAAKAGGLVAELIETHGVTGRLSVAPPATD